MNELYPNLKTHHYINSCASTEKLHLTQREIQCLAGVVKGLSSKNIARKLNLSYRTIEFYIANIKKKYGCRTKFELMSVFVQLPND